MIALLRDPLVHFLAIGLLVFGIDRQRTPGPAATVITVDDVLIQDIREVLSTDLERLPTPAELTRAVDGWVEREVLVREARARGLDRGDPEVRARLAERMAFVLGARAVPTEPDEATLRALYAAQQADFRVTLQVTLRQCFVGESKARADALLALAQAGATRAELAERCDPPPGGPVLRGRSRERLVAKFGESFVEDIATVPLNAWHLRRSTRGWHVTRVERRRDGRPIGFEQARGRLIARWRRAQLADAKDAALQALRDRYEVRGWPR